MIGNFSHSESNAVLRWMETFTFNREFVDFASGQLTADTISDGMPIIRILQDAEPSMFAFNDIEPQSGESERSANIDKILENIDDHFLQHTQMWTASKVNMGNLELVVRQTIGIALKSSKAETYIEQLMGLEEDVQEDLGAIVESCLGSIEDGSSSRSSALSLAESASSQKTGQSRDSIDSISLRSADLQITSNMSLEERKTKEVQKQIIMVEKEATALRDKNAVLEREVARLSTENEDMKKDQDYLAGGKQLIEKKVQDEMAKCRVQMNKEILAYQDTHADEIEEKDKKISELEHQLGMLERQHEDRIERLQRELDESKESISVLKRDVAKIKIYEKKVEQMNDLRSELTDAQMLNQSLQSNLDMMTEDAEKEQHIEETLNRIREELSQVKIKSNNKDLQIQEFTFTLNDAEIRIRELEQKQVLHLGQIDKLTSESSQLAEELRLTKKETEHSAKSDTQRADLRDKYNALMQENKSLQKELDAKFSAERFNQEQELEDAKRDLTLADAKNKQLEQRISQLQGRLGGGEEASNLGLVAAETQHQEAKQAYERQSWSFKPGQHPSYQQHQQMESHSPFERVLNNQNNERTSSQTMEQNMGAAFSDSPNIFDSTMDISQVDHDHAAASSQHNHDQFGDKNIDHNNKIQLIDNPVIALVNARKCDPETAKNLPQGQLASQRHTIDPSKVLLSSPLLRNKTETKQPVSSRVPHKFDCQEEDDQADHHQMNKMIKNGLKYTACNNITVEPYADSLQTVGQGTIQKINNQIIECEAEGDDYCMGDNKYENNFDNKSIMSEFRGQLQKEKLDALQVQNDELYKEVMQLRQSLQAREQMLEAKDAEFEAKMKQKDKWLEEQKKIECTRMRKLTQKIQAKLKPKQAELLGRAQ